MLPYYYFFFPFPDWKKNFIHHVESFSALPFNRSLSGVVLKMLHSLEEYIVEMENRSAITNNQHSNLSEDIWTQLQQKENDLVLAAELGKALLEKNEELKKQHESLIEEYSKKLEVNIFRR